MQDDTNFFWMDLPAVKIEAGSKDKPAATSTIFDWQEKGFFPHSYKLGPQMARWKSTEIFEWKRDPAAWRAKNAQRRSA